MKKLLFIPILISVLISLSSLNFDDSKTNKTYIIIQKDTKYSIDFCEKALNEANWCGFRYKDKRNTIQFDTGLKVELFSTTEIGETNSNCILTDYRDSSNDIWRFAANGKIVHLMSPLSK